EIPLMVAVSGGKDSLSVWNVLHELGFRTKGLHINLGIEGFSELSSEAVKRFAKQRDLPWVEYSLEETFGYSILEVQKRTRRKICSICGSLKRQMLNRLTIREGFRTLVTGHNLDDEAGRLLGNIVRNRFQYLEKQYPSLPSSHPRLPAKIKPLYRLEIHEILTYCSLKGIELLAMGCPLSRGATSRTFKEALDFLEEAMPGTKRDFLFSFVNRRKAGVGASRFNSCVRCGEASYGDTCSVCNLREQLEEDAAQAPEAESNVSEIPCPLRE
ncbi:MAG: ATP-binding protein, partial [Syntrophobacteraceae bacterium]